MRYMHGRPRSIECPAASQEFNLVRYIGRWPEMGVQALLNSSLGSAFPARLGFRDAAWPLQRLRVAGWKERKRINLFQSRACICRSKIKDSFESEEGSAALRDAFRTAPPPELLDNEFFSQMNRALEESRHARGREFHGIPPAPEFEPPRPSPGHGVDAPQQQALCALQRGVPSSIKKLRRRGGESAGPCAIKRAFSSMVYMIKAVQSHALQIRQVMFAETWDVQEVLQLVHKEMHASFVWLFQRVFACTPKLMMSVMILLANFTVFSMAVITDSTPPAISHFLTAHGNPQTELVPKVWNQGVSEPDAAVVPSPRAGSGGNFRVPGAPIAEGFDDDDSWLTGAMKEQVQLAREISSRRLVAPHLEADNYGCFDRTDLDYQLAIAKDPFSPVLLANYAQFLFVVRRDHHRAEEYFHRAMEADPRDSTILDRFASFLWLGQGDRGAAERVYKAAVAADPESSYNAGSYAHFLWHAGDGDNSSHGRMA